MPNIATINGIAENNISHHNGGAAALYTSKNGDTWVHWTALAADESVSGVSVSTSGNYKYHTFTSSANFTVTTVGHGILTSCWLVGGGGGATGSSGGGGGAGGWDQYDNITVSSTGSYYVTIGGGGDAGTTSGGVGGMGNDTTIATLTYSGSDTMAAKGGAYSAGYTNIDSPDTGASGGGGATHGGSGDYGSCTGGTYSPYNGRRQGYNGGNADSASIYVFSAAGGGGASAAGNNARKNSTYTSNGWNLDPNGSKGGAGLPINIGGGNVYYSGGGSGSTGYVNSATTAGGNGGGGNGGGYATGTAGTNGTTNRGGGAGGSYGAGTVAAGGSGICIIKYQYQQ
jgi:hypothetical protein